MNINALNIPEFVSVEGTVIVPKDVPAMELVPAENGARLGQIALLRKGTPVDICGSGFSERTVKVRSENRFYFIYLQDIDPGEEAGAEY